MPRKITKKEPIKLIASINWSIKVQIKKQINNVRNLIPKWTYSFI